MAEKEYIERERYCDMNKFAQSICEDMTLTEEEANKFISLLWQQPTADVTEVKHGEWMHDPPFTAPNGNYLKASECSVCHAVFVSNGNEPYSDYPYCCQCGAKMDGGKNE